MASSRTLPMTFLTHTAPLPSNLKTSLGAPSDPPVWLKSALKAVRPFDKTSLNHKIVFLLRHAYSGKWLKHYQQQANRFSNDKEHLN